MRLTTKQLFSFFIVLLIVFFISVYELPYYIYKPGSADDLSEMVKVEDGYDYEGSMHLVTVSSMKATPVTYLLAKLLPYHEVLRDEEVRPDDITDEDYNFIQLHMMENSQEASTVVAYEAAGKDVEIVEAGVFVTSVQEDMPANGILSAGDQIIKVDQTEINNADDLTSYINTKDDNDQVMIEWIREGETKKEEITLKQFPDDESRVGLGIQLMTYQKVEANPKLSFTSGKIGGPSAGLMFALEIYNQLTEEDITKGKKIIGSGAVDLDGNVNRIGSIDKKIVAADKEGFDIFFAANESGVAGSNYEEAKKTAEEIDSDMEIVPVDTFYDALDYLADLEK